MGNIYGYARCSTNDTKQDITRQTSELKALGVPEENMYFEYESGMKNDRLQFQRMLEKLENGDTIMATELTRITRSTKYFIEIIELAQEKKLKLVLGNFELDCTKELDPMTKGMVMMMSVFAQLERDMIAERVKSGMANAKRKGKTFGRPAVTYKTLPPMVKKLYPMFKNGELKKYEYAKLCDISRPTLDVYLKILDEKKKLDN